MVGGLAKVEAECFLQEGDAVAADSASEAVPEPFRGFNRETGCVVLMEGAPGLEVLALAFEFVTLGAEVGYSSALIMKVVII